MVTVPTKVATGDLNARQAWTDDSFQALPKGRYEVVAGELIAVGNAGLKHGWLASTLMIILGSYVRSQRLGIMCDSSTAFTLKNGNRRAPDLAFLAKERLPETIPSGYFVGAPDLAVEILSGSNTVEEMHAKVVEYFESGCRLLWILHPEEEYILVYRQPFPEQLLRRDDILTAAEVVPGFSVAVATLFGELDV